MAERAQHRESGLNTSKLKKHLYSVNKSYKTSKDQKKESSDTHSSAGPDSNICNETLTVRGRITSSEKP